MTVVVAETTVEHDLSAEGAQRIERAMIRAGLDQANRENALIESGRRLFTFTLDGSTYYRDLFKTLHDGDYYEPGVEDAPFFTEAFLYNLLGKQDARTVLSAVNSFATMAGFGHEDLVR